MLHAPIVYFSVSPELALPDGAAPAIALAALEAWKLLAHCTNQNQREPRLRIDPQALRPRFKEPEPPGCTRLTWAGLAPRRMRLPRAPSMMYQAPGIKVEYKAEHILQ